MDYDEALEDSLRSTAILTENQSAVTNCMLEFCELCEFCEFCKLMTGAQSGIDKSGKFWQHFAFPLTKFFLQFFWFQIAQRGLTEPVGRVLVQIHRMSFDLFVN